MNVQVVLVLAMGFPAGVDKKGDTVKKELKKIQGGWVLVFVEVNGEVYSEKDTKLTVKGEKFTFRSGSWSLGGTFTLDPTQKPKRFNVWWGEDSKAKEDMTLGIYEFDRGKLKVCCTVQGGDRPKVFSTKKGGTGKNTTLLMVFKRAKKEE
jgi:uncharacterized protein (TIGR03067 family)